MILSTYVNFTYVYGGIMNTVAKIVENEFSQVYTHFKEFQMNPEYKPYWDQCMAAVRDQELLSHIIFCNDLFCIPPVKTFLTYYTEDFKQLTGNDRAILPLFEKKSIGAFWGMVFKKALGYPAQKNVSVSMHTHFGVKTATYFIKAKEE